jgi:hypothetical protein
VIDDISYVRRSVLETSVLFELICHSYERCSLLVTSNQPFRELDEILPSGSMPVAAVDRLVHHGQIVGIRGESYLQKGGAAKGSGDTAGPPMSLGGHHDRHDEKMRPMRASGVLRRHEKCSNHPKLDVTFRPD